jgi:hypothetical protein
LSAPRLNEPIDITAIIIIVYSTSVVKGAVGIIENNMVCCLKASYSGKLANRAVAICQYSPIVEAAWLDIDCECWGVAWTPLIVEPVKTAAGSPLYLIVSRGWDISPIQFEIYPRLGGTVRG